MLGALADAVRDIDLADSFDDARRIVRSCRHLLGDHGGVTLFSHDQQNQLDIRPAPAVRGKGQQALDLAPSLAPHPDPPRSPFSATGPLVADFYVSPPTDTYATETPPAS